MSVFYYTCLFAFITSNKYDFTNLPEGAGWCNLLINFDLVIALKM